MGFLATVGTFGLFKNLVLYLKTILCPAYLIHEIIIYLLLATTGRIYCGTTSARRAPRVLISNSAQFPIFPWRIAIWCGVTVQTP